MAITLIVFLSFIFRIISLNQSLWLDEATSALVAKMSFSDIFTKFLPGDFHPPLYYLILKFWTSVFGFSEISLRIPSVIFGIGTVYLTYLIAKKIYNNKTALVSAALIATSGLSIYYSQEARMYSLAAFLIAFLFYAYLENKWLIFSILLAMVGMTDYVSLFVLPVFLIASRKDWKKLLLAFIPFVLTFVFWLPTFVKQLAGGFSQTGSNWWSILGVLSMKNILLIPIKFGVGRISFDNQYLYATIALFVLSLFGYLLISAGLAIKNKSGVVWLWLIVPVCVGILLSFKIPTLSYFRFLFILPAFYILISSGLEKIEKYRNLFLILAICINIFSSGIYLFNPKFHREDWRSAAATIADNKVIFPSDSQKEALIYYGKANNIVLSNNFLGKDGTVWLSRYVWEIFDPSDSTKKKLESLGYNKAQEVNFNGVVLWKYIKK